jgi:uncharacterized protein with GYD domain
MPLFMAQFAYTPQAWSALIHAPQDRAGASDTLLKHFGGRLLGLYYTPGAEYDGFCLFEAPNDAAAAAVEIADVAGGHLRSNRLLRVLSADEMQTALKQAGTAPNIGADVARLVSRPAVPAAASKSRL